MWQKYNTLINMQNGEENRNLKISLSVLKIRHYDV